MKVRDCNYVSLFDEVQVNTRIHSCLKIDFWGIVRYLFFTFYRKGRLEGSFRVCSPDICLGYSKIGTSQIETTGKSNQSHNSSESSEVEDPGDERTSNNSTCTQSRIPSNTQIQDISESSTYIKTMVTLNPLLMSLVKSETISFSREKHDLVN